MLPIRVQFLGYGLPGIGNGSAGLVTFICVMLILSTARDASAQWGPMRVVTDRAVSKTMPSTLTLVGTVEPIRRSVVGSEVEGLVESMNVRQGDRVHAGQVLCALRDDTVEAELAAAKANLASLRAKLAELDAGTRKEEIDRLKAIYESEKAEYERWTFERQRVEKLYGAESSNRKEVYDTEAGYRAAEAMVAAAQAAYEEAVAGPRAEVIEAARQDVAEQEAVVGRIAYDLKKMRIVAPYDGYIVERLTEEGEWVTTGGAVVDLVDLSSVLVRIYVPESAIAFVRVGDKARVAVDALESTGRSIFEGTVFHVLRQADPRARTFPVEIKIENEYFRPASMDEDAVEAPLVAGGMFARATVVSGPRREVAAVPQDAVVRREGVDYVCVVREQPPQGGPPQGEASSGPSYMAFPTSVTTGVSIDHWIAVTSGNIEPGAQVVVLGNENIRFPMPVAIVDPSELANERPNGPPNENIEGRSES